MKPPSNHPASVWWGLGLAFTFCPSLLAQNLPTIHIHTFDAGGGKATAANVSLDTSIGGWAGFAGVSGGSPMIYPGYVGQLHKVRPVLGAPGFVFPNSVSIPVFGEDDRLYALQTSARLGADQWVTVWTGRTVNGVAVLIHPGVVTQPQRFYRVVQLP